MSNQDSKLIANDNNEQQNSGSDSESDDRMGKGSSIKMRARRGEMANREEGRSAGSRQAGHWLGGLSGSSVSRLCFEFELGILPQRHGTGWKSWRTKKQHEGNTAQKVWADIVWHCLVACGCNTIPNCPQRPKRPGHQAVARPCRVQTLRSRWAVGRVIKGGSTGGDSGFAVGQNGATEHGSRTGF